MEKRVRIAIEVVAGLIPGTPIADYRKLFIIPSEVWYAEGEWEGKKEEAAALCKKIQQDALDYQAELWNPQYLNWVKSEWIYF